MSKNVKESFAYATSFPVANFFIEKAGREKKNMSLMKLIKSVYLSYGWFLVKFEQPLFPEKPVAWEYGPVIPSLYYACKMYGSDSITEPFEIPEKIKPEHNRFFQDMFQTYAEKLDALQLATLSHKLNTPWDITLKEKGEGTIIADDVIRKFYKEKENTEDYNKGL